jgi:hypothetical protein
MSSSLGVIRYNTDPSTVNEEANKQYWNVVNKSDAGLHNLYEMPGSRPDVAKQLYNGTMVAGTVWSVLAASLIYYSLYGSGSE